MSPLHDALKVLRPSLDPSHVLYISSPKAPSSLGSSCTSNDFYQLASDDGLTSPVEEDLETGDHFARVLGGVFHGVPAGRLLASVAFSERPEERVGEGVLAHVGKDSVVDFEGGEIGYRKSASLTSQGGVCGAYGIER